MKTALKERLKQVNLLDPSQPFLERVGGLYYWGRQPDPTEGQKRLRQVLTSIQPKEEREFQLSLHAAILLAQSGEFDGIAYLLQYIQTESDRTRLELVETALRNCSQFPLAVLIAQALDLRQLNDPAGHVGKFVKFSDDDLFNLAEQEDAPRSQHELLERLDYICRLSTKPGRGLAPATLISRPLHTDRGFRYTGFILVEPSTASPLVVSYDLGDVLNRDDPRAHEDVWELVRFPGRQAIVVYDTQPPYEARQLYLLPFSPLTDSQLEEKIALLYLQNIGLQVQMVAALSVNESGKYRVISSNGQSSVMVYRKEDQKIGHLFLKHSANSQAMDTRLYLSIPRIAEFARRYKEVTTLDRAVYIRTFNSLHTLVTQRGEPIRRSGKIKSDTVYLVDEFTNREGKTIRIPFDIPTLAWTEEERCQVVSDFFSHSPFNWSVLLQIGIREGKQYADIFHPHSANVLHPIVTQEYAPGTIAFYEMGKDNRPHANPLSGYRVAGTCTDCYGTGSRPCEYCRVERGRCSYCRGRRVLPCSCGGYNKGHIIAV